MSHGIAVVWMTSTECDGTSLPAAAEGDADAASLEFSLSLNRMATYFIHYDVNLE